MIALPVPPTAQEDFDAVEVDVDEWRARLNTPDLSREQAYEYVAARLADAL